MQEIVAVAKRENNPKRNYLVLNRLQAKHVPGSPKKALAYFEELADLTGKAWAGERLLLVGFAETATAIGAALAVKLKTSYVQTTREEMAGATFLYFTEAHSHAVQQKLIKDDLDKIIGSIDRIVFVEDELTTGNTIGNIVSLLRKTYTCPVKFGVVSLLNGMDSQAVQRFAREEIELYFLQKTDYRDFPSRAEKVKGDGEYFLPHPLAVQKESREEKDYDPKEAQGKKEQDDLVWEVKGQDDLVWEAKEQDAWVWEAKEQDVVVWEAKGCRNARRLTDGISYASACEALWGQFLEINGKIQGKKLLVLGTEELMYPALFLGSRLEEENKVTCHGTTRSPILVSREPDYLLHSRYELISLYAQERRTFVYNLDTYDQAIIITDAPVLCKEGWNSLLWALQQSGNQKIQLIRWCG